MEKISITTVCIKKILTFQGINFMKRFIHYFMQQAMTAISGVPDQSGQLHDSGCVIESLKNLGSQFLFYIPPKMHVLFYQLTHYKSSNP